MGDERSKNPWHAELDDTLRALSGAFLFGVPLLYTMEMWWKGNIVYPSRMIVTLALIYLGLVLLNFAYGFRRHQEQDWSRLFSDSAEALALALMASAVSLAVVGALRLDLGLRTNLGRIIMEAVPFAIGIGVSSFLVDGKNNQEGESGGHDGTQDASMNKEEDGGGLLQGTLADVGATALGATFIGFSIAPTDEVKLIAGQLSSPGLLVVMGTSLLLSYIIVFESSFASHEKRRQQSGILQNPLSETVASYLISLLMAVAMVWFFQLLDFNDPIETWISYGIVLGLPTTIGGAAGRVAI